MSYSPGDKIFAKVKGFPHWPARINALPAEVPIPKGKYPIFFYGTHEVYFLTTKDIYPYEKNREKFSKPKPRAHFNAGLEEIQNNPSVLFYGVDPRAEIFLSRFYKFTRTDGGGGEEEEEEEEEDEDEDEPLSTLQTSRKRPASKERRESKAKKAKHGSDVENDEGATTTTEDESEDSESESEASDSDSDAKPKKKKKKKSYSNDKPQMKELTITLTRVSASDRLNTSTTPATKKARKPAAPKGASKPKVKKPVKKAGSSDDESMSSISSDSDSGKSPLDWQIQAANRKKEIEERVKEYEKKKEKEELTAIKKAAKELRAARKSSTSEKTSKSEATTPAPAPKKPKKEATQADAEEKKENASGRPLRESAKKFLASKKRRKLPSDHSGSAEDSDKDSDFDEKKVKPASSPDDEKESSSDEDKPPLVKHEKRALIVSSDSEDDADKVSPPRHANKKKIPHPVSNDAAAEDSNDTDTKKPENGASVKHKEAVKPVPKHVPEKPKKKPADTNNRQKARRKSEDVKHHKKVLPSSSSSSSSEDEDSRMEKLKEMKKKEKLEKKKREKLQELTMEAKLRLINREIKASLVRGQEEFAVCLEQLDALTKMEIKLTVLVKCWELMDTIKKCRRYKLSEDVKMGAQKVFNKFLDIYAKADKEDVVRAQVELMKNQSGAKGKGAETTGPTVPQTVADLFHGGSSISGTPAPATSASEVKPAPTVTPAVVSQSQPATPAPASTPVSGSGQQVEEPSPHLSAPPSNAQDEAVEVDDILTTIPGFELAKTKLGLMGGQTETSQPSISHLLPSSESKVSQPVTTQWPANPPTINRNRKTSEEQPPLFADEFEVLDSYESDSDTTPAPAESERRDATDYPGGFGNIDLDSRIAQLMGGSSAPRFPHPVTSRATSSSSSRQHAFQRGGGLGPQVKTGLPGERRPKGNDEDDEIYNLLGV